jgi:hypothetical protein
MCSMVPGMPLCALLHNLCVGRWACGQVIFQIQLFVHGTRTYAQHGSSMGIMFCTSPVMFQHTWQQHYKARPLPLDWQLQVFVLKEFSFLRSCSSFPPLSILFPSTSPYLAPGYMVVDCPVTPCAAAMTMKSEGPMASVPAKIAKAIAPAVAALNVAVPAVFAEGTGEVWMNS